MTAVSAAPAERYFEQKLMLATDPLLAAARLAASGLHDDYVVYENDGQWSYAGGAVAEVYLDRSGAHLRSNDELSSLPWNGSPLDQVRELLAKVSVPGWRAYGWAAFELAYAKSGNTDAVGDGRLLHLVVPHTEIVLGQGWVRLRSADRGTLASAEAVLRKEAEESKGELSALDVREHGGPDYRRAVQVAVEEINTGTFQKVIFSRVVPIETEIDFAGTYVAGRRGNTPARSFLLRLDGLEAAGFSPEIVVQVSENGRVVSQPLAGTRAHTGDPAENEQLRADLLSDAKEIYEHAISVKVAYDELQAVCAPDSLVVEEFMTVKERGSVQHLASRVAGQLAVGRQAWDAFDAVFPAVTASGVPKNAVYPSIREQETEARGLYSGAVLTVGQDGTMDAALVLRAVYRQNGRTWLRAGAGIVGQSRPEREFEETCEKLDSVARFLVPSQQALSDAHLAISRSYFV